MKSICFTGHREINSTKELKASLINTLCKLIEDGAADFYAGGAIGWDMLCEVAVIKVKRKYPHIKLHLVLPCSQQEQSSNWSEKEKQWYYSIAAQADSIEYASDHYYGGCMKDRNQRLVNHAEACICYYSCIFKSGTGQTVRMAERKGIPIINLYNG